MPWLLLVLVVWFLEASGVIFLVVSILWIQLRVSMYSRTKGRQSMLDGSGI